MKTLEQPKTGLAGLKAHWKDDLISGFSVSLIALPLCLGIAIASGFPPLAGLLTAIVGGILASRVSGSFVTISGPAAGLIVINLAAAESLGGAGAESGFAGYPFALAAIVIAGLMVAAFGLLKVGKLGDYFPSAAVHGMLAAIGVIIMVKQFFPAIGVSSPKGELFEVMAEIPRSFMHINPSAGLVALVTLVILIGHPFIRFKWIKVIPAPMWVLLVTIPMASLIGGENLALVELPKKLLGEGGVEFPDFSKIAMGAFWTAVVSIALVSAIESLLSAKAVDSLDPYKRKSNLDRDLVSMGGGSSVAGLIGGLPMISEIVRSSANVNNGGKTQWANFFHGSFLLIFLLLAAPLIEMIPLSALAAMLVYTGFRLAHPREFKHMFQTGIMELEIFVVTLVAVLATDLVIGICVGILFKYVLMFTKGVKFSELFQSKAEVTMDGDRAEIKLSGSQIFSNYLALKKKMDKASKDANSLVLDLNEVTFIDHTVMHHLEDYQKNLILQDKHMELLHLDSLQPVSNHPLAARSKSVKVAKQHRPVKVNHREREVANWAQENKFRFAGNLSDFQGWDFYTLTIRREVVSIENAVAVNQNGTHCDLADIKVQKGAITTAEYDTTTVLRLSIPASVPKFFMSKETMLDRIADLAEGKDIDFVEYPEFSRRYVLQGEDEKEVREFFTSPLLKFFEDNPEFMLIGNGKDLLLHRGEKTLPVHEMDELLKAGLAISELISADMQHRMQ